MTDIDPKRPASDAHSGSRSGSSVRGADHGVKPSEPVIHDAAPLRSSKQARQGPLGRPVLYVLIAGLVLAMLAWAAAELFTGGASRFNGSGSPSTTGTANQQSTAGGFARGKRFSGSNYAGRSWAGKFLRAVAFQRQREVIQGRGVQMTFSTLPAPVASITTRSAPSAMPLA